MSLIKNLKSYNKKSIIPLHMPGGKRNSSLLDLPDPYSIDITEIEGFDNLHKAEGILKDEMKRASAFYGSSETLFCVNGSTGALIAAVCGALDKGSKVLVARNCHICIINAIILRELDPFFLYPKVNDFGIFAGVTLEEIKSALYSAPDVKAVILTSPTYEGVISEIKEIAAFLHEKGIMLIVDEAHGAHFFLSDYFPESSVAAGADIVVNSLHKTLPALTQTALLHLNGDLVNRDRVRAFWNIYHTTSPSYVLMGSISACFDFLESDRGRLFTEMYIENLQEIRERLSSLEKIILFTSDDPGKLVLLAENGEKLYKKLLTDYNIQLEMATPGYVVAMTSVSDKKENLESFFYALKEIDGVSDAVDILNNSFKYNKALVHERVMPPYIAFEEGFGKKAKGEPKRAGDICFESVVMYPPGIPLVIPGEIFKKDDLS